MNDAEKYQLAEQISQIQHEIEQLKAKFDALTEQLPESRYHSSVQYFLEQADLSLGRLLHQFVMSKKPR